MLKRGMNHPLLKSLPSLQSLRCTVNFTLKVTANTLEMLSDLSSWKKKSGKDYQPSGMHIDKFAFKYNIDIEPNAAKWSIRCLKRPVHHHKQELETSRKFSDQIPLIISHQTWWFCRSRGRPKTEGPGLGTQSECIYILFLTDMSFLQGVRNLSTKNPKLWVLSLQSFPLDAHSKSLLLSLKRPKTRVVFAFRRKNKISPEKCRFQGTITTSTTS